MRPCVLLTAAPGESRAICRGAASTTPPTRDREAVELAPGLWLVQSGVGKVSAAISALRAVQTLRPASMISIGVAGALPRNERGSTPLPMGSIVLADACIYADEGIRTPTGFTDMARAGFGPSGLTGMSVLANTELTAELRMILTQDSIPGATLAEGGVATVSTCSGTHALAADIAARTGAIAEAMEGAAIAHALAACSPDVRFAELRVISNTTGDRDAQIWDLPGAFDVLAQISGRLVRH